MTGIQTVEPRYHPLTGTSSWSQPVTFSALAGIEDRNEGYPLVFTAEGATTTSGPDGHI
jgi:hypothetical protein